MSEHKIDLHRIHGFDALRAIMMMLGLVLHTAMTYSDIDYKQVWPLKDSLNTSHAFHLLIEYIHLFRMPAFFVIAGFFGALLFYKKGAKEMVWNRIHRVVYPFFVALFILWPLAVFAFNFSGRAMAGADNNLTAALAVVFPDGLIPQNTIHLWFLYYLALISFIGWGLALILKNYDYCHSKIKVVFDNSHNQLFMLMIPFTLITFLTLLWMGSSTAITSSGFIPDAKTLVFYLLFYLYGWVLYRSKEIIEVFIKPTWLMLVLGTVGFVLKVYLDMGDDPTMLYLAMFINSLSTWLLIFGFMGLFLRYASSGTFALRYISDSAYWVYLIHLPLIAFLAGFFAGVNLSVYIKFLVILVSTTIICFITYQLWVRNSFIGEFLNGRKYPPRQK